MGKYNFEEFTQKQSRSTIIPLITISKSGIFVFNKITMASYVKNNGFAKFFYDKTKKVIGIKLLKDEAVQSYKIRRERNGALGSISGVSFLGYYKIPHKETRPYKFDYDKEENILIIKLEENI